MPTQVKRSVCPFDCPDACGLLVEVENDRAVRVAGDPDHPYTRGTLCPKMNRYQDTVHSPRRLTTPLLRTGAKGAGAFRAISWDEAIALIAERWQTIIAKHGAEAILPYSYAGTMGLIQRNAGHPFFHRLGASRLKRTICTPAMDVGWNAVMGDTPALHPDAVADSDLVILWGINAVATNVHFLHGVRAARLRGAKVWLIDTYRTPTAEVADQTFLVRPGHDGALALGLMHLLVREGLVDRLFLETSVTGFAELEQQVLPDYPPERVSALTGLDEATLLEMAQAYGRARAPFIRIGGGLCRYGNSAMTVRSIVALPALVGAWSKPGGGCFCSTSTGAAFAMHEVLREDFLTTPTRTINMNQLGDALNDLGGSPVLSLYVYHSNPAASTPDQNRVLQGLAREDLFTVVHERFLTDTARYADVVLPATTSLEHSDLYRAYGTYCIQRAQAVIPPIGHSRSNWQVFTRLAEAMGFEESFFAQSADDLIDRLLAIPTPMREGIDTDALQQGKAVELRIPVTARPYATPSGKIELLNPRQPAALPLFIPPYAGSQPLKLMTAPNPYALNSSFYERDDLRGKQQAMSLKMNADDAAKRGLTDGELVIASNELGEVHFLLQVSKQVPAGVVVAEGVWWLEFAPGERSVNALTSQRLTDQGAGSTFYDNTVEVRPAR